MLGFWQVLCYRQVPGGMRIGIVPYLNAVPLVHGLAAERFRAVPGRLAQRAVANDIILAPMVEAFQNRDWYLIDGVGIGSFGAVETVKLIFNKSGLTPCNVNRIKMDSDSVTSQALLKILLIHYYRRPPAAVEFVTTSSPAEAFLKIGDKVWDFPDLPSLDLGAAWTQWTGLPFVYACWITRSRAVALEWKQTLIDQAQKNLRHLAQLATQVPPHRCPDLLGYWRQLKYDLDNDSKKGIDLFQQYWCQLEAKPLLQLNWI